MLSGLATLALFSIGAFCWGNLGHRTVAYLAVEYLSQDEVEHLQRLAGFDDLSDAALWADEVSQQPEYAYSASWHYVNVHDSPPESCGVLFPRDHAVGSSDILTAFQNHTEILTACDSTTEQIREAVRYLIHWVGDIHQPLHVEAIGRGGVDVPVLFDGRSTNLHAVWDIEVPEKYRGLKNGTQAAERWAKELFSKDTDPGKTLQKKCQSISAPLECILEWARQSNAAVCDAVLSNGVDAVHGRELGGMYFDMSIPVVEAQVALAGRRLAQWLRAILNHKMYQDTVAYDSLQHVLSPW